MTHPRLIHAVTNLPPSPARPPHQHQHHTPHADSIDKTSATSVISLFFFACFATPVLGAWLSDAHLGRYSTILALSIVHLVGNAMMAGCATVPALGGWAGVATALGLVALGTGGIKPCVSAFGADQIRPFEPYVVRPYFSFFYVAMNAGAVLSTITTPILRQQLGYGVAFGMPALLMAVAVFAFWSGRHSYHRAMPVGNPFGVSARILVAALGATVRGRGPWHLDAAVLKHGEEQVADVRQLTKCVALMAAAPIFWSLYDQQSSRYPTQAARPRLSLPRSTHNRRPLPP